MIYYEDIGGNVTHRKISTNSLPRKGGSATQRWDDNDFGFFPSRSCCCFCYHTFHDSSAGAASSSAGAASSSAGAASPSAGAAPSAGASPSAFASPSFASPSAAAGLAFGCFLGMPRNSSSSSSSLATSKAS